MATWPACSQHGRGRAVEPERDVDLREGERGHRLVEAHMGIATAQQRKQLVAHHLIRAHQVSSSLAWACARRDMAIIEHVIWV
jgi:hypothetical protein